MENFIFCAVTSIGLNPKNPAVSHIDLHSCTQIVRSLSLYKNDADLFEVISYNVFRGKTSDNLFIVLMNFKELSWNKNDTKYDVSHVCAEFFFHF